MTDGFSEVTAVVVEADGASRGNPGPAAYGAVLKDAATGVVLAERGERIGVASNNVAEYQGLIAGLEMAVELVPQASVEVRMDSKLVVEQMSGNWKIKHPSMRPLAARAQALAPSGTVYTWVPRAENGHADRLGNEALDGTLAPGVHVVVGAVADEVAEDVAEDVAGERDQTQPGGGWMPPTDPPTTLILVRHGVTDHTAKRLFSGGLGGANPGLNDEGRAQVRATGDWLAPLADQVDALISSPVRRTRESAEILAERFAKPVLVEDGVAEMEFGLWDGLSFAEIQERYPDDLSAWLGNLDVAPSGGESFREVEARVLEGRDRILAAHTGQTVVVVSHVTPIKTLVADAVGAPLDALYKMELSPASVTVISYFRGATPQGDGGNERLSNLRLFNGRPTDAPL
ncbi:bifunctional RNase H/acid phosphatase [Marmoricola sp. RAF53]|uniref:bifunctional RNase H/acid phosphatase n=1 Tax=Marmoricola sp. RAF53 TaxID=3233059 RepID=UPI003F9C291C